MPEVRYDEGLTVCFTQKQISLIDELKSERHGKAAGKKNLAVAMNTEPDRAMAGLCRAIWGDYQK